MPISSKICQATVFKLRFKGFSYGNISKVAPAAVGRTLLPFVVIDHARGIVFPGVKGGP